ncbi:hypothetical protein [Haloechinothrix sp. LS1_15]|uniref:hypothetical protein n=1 Tax=Haloechinothrix sp. LS1_15 TaxID=2652248 RepID=UPI0029448718|nr:hypothetical protein [Haloechinothrix sp. LS1_15]MDV6014489.1 esterase-like activity of phytase family protein [Haloechinothrix sp. LS1_15]
MGPRCSGQGRAARPVLVAVACLALLIGGAAPVAAEPDGVPSPHTLCIIDDERLPAISGMVADGDHWYVVNDGGWRLEVYVLDRDCVVREVRTDDTNPFDVEDLARGPDGTLWLSDTGDNHRERDTVALHELAPDGRATLYRLTYPDGPRDAEALLLDRDGVPHIVTKTETGRPGVYRPEEPLRSPGPTPLERVAELTISPTDTTGGPAGFLGSVLVTGGAVSADGGVIALRTYTDAYLFAAPDGDVVAALQREPVRIPLPDEPQGEALAFEPDGTLLSTSEGVGQPVRAVPGAVQLVSDPPEDQGGAGERASEPAAISGAIEATGWIDVWRSPERLAVIAAGGLAVILVIAVATWRARRSHR